MGKKITSESTATGITMLGGPRTRQKTNTELFNMVQMTKVKSELGEIRKRAKIMDANTSDESGPTLVSKKVLKRLMSEPQIRRREKQHIKRQTTVVEDIETKVECVVLPYPMSVPLKDVLETVTNPSHRSTVNLLANVLSIDTVRNTLGPIKANQPNQPYVPLGHGLELLESTESNNEVWHRDSDSESSTDNTSDHLSTTTSVAESSFSASHQPVLSSKTRACMYITRSTEMFARESILGHIDGFFASDASDVTNFILLLGNYQLKCLLHHFVEGDTYYGSSATESISINSHYPLYSAPRNHVILVAIKDIEVEAENCTGGKTISIECQYPFQCELIRDLTPKLKNIHEDMVNLELANYAELLNLFTLAVDKKKVPRTPANRSSAANKDEHWVLAISYSASLDELFRWSQEQSSSNESITFFDPRFTMHSAQRLCSEEIVKKSKLFLVQ